MVKIIDNYSLVEELGSGIFSTVFKGQHLITKKQVAVKMVRVQKLKQYPKLSEYINNQANILSSMESSPHIIQFYSMLRSSKNLYFVYEFCNEGTLENLLRKQKNQCFNRKTSIIYLRQILQAFKVLTAHNVMHRDLKPQNIFLHNGVLKLGDFGFCKHLQTPEELSQTMLGSPIYMAPEVLKGDPYTNKADIWSLGVILYRMLYGMCPYESNNIAQLISIHNTRDVVLPKNVENTPLQQLLLNMLKKNPYQRIEWGQIFSRYQVTENGEIYLSNTKHRNYPNYEIKMQKIKSANFSEEYQGNKSNLRASFTSLKTNLNVNSNANEISTKNTQNSQINNTHTPNNFGRTQGIEYSYSKTQLGKGQETVKEKSSEGRRSHIISKSPIRNSNLGAPTYNFKLRIEHYIKAHQKCVEMNYITSYLLNHYQDTNSSMVSIIISKNLERDLIQLQKSVLKDYQSDQEQQYFFFTAFKGIIEEEIVGIKGCIEFLCETVQVSFSLIEKKKMEYLSNLVRIVELQNIQQIVVISQLIDYFEEGIFLNRNTYEMMGKQQLIKKIKIKYKTK